MSFIILFSSEKYGKQNEGAPTHSNQNRKDEWKRERLKIRMDVKIQIVFSIFAKDISLNKAKCQDFYNFKLENHPFLNG